MLCELGFGRSDYKNNGRVGFDFVLFLKLRERLTELRFAKTPSWLISVTCHTRRAVLLFFYSFDFL